MELIVSPLLQNAFDKYVLLCRGFIIRKDRLSPLDISLSKQVLDEHKGVIPGKLAVSVYQLLARFSDDLRKNNFDFSKVPRPQLTQTPTATGPTKVTNRTITLAGELFEFRFPYSEELILEIKRIDGHRWDKDKRVWTLPVMRCEAVERLGQQNNFIFGATALTRIHAIKNNLEDSYSANYIELGLPLSKQLFGFQTQGISYGMKNQRVIIGDEMGLGKTIQSIGVVVGLEAYPCLVICPASLKYNWQNEIHEWTKKKAVVITDKMVSQVPYWHSLGLLDFAIMNPESVKKYLIESEKLTEDKRMIIKPNGLSTFFKAGIVDEAHVLRNMKTKAFKRVKSVFNKMEIRVLNTGTPVVNDPADLWALITILGLENEFGGYVEFMKKYRGLSKAFIEKGQTAEKDRKVLEELNFKLRTLCFIRREKKQVLKELPDKVRQIIPVEITNRAEYDHCYINVLDFLVAKGADQEALQRAAKAELLVMMNQLRQLSGQGKIDALMELIERITGEGEKVVVFCWFLETARAIKARFPQAVGITGDEEDTQIETNKNAFQTDPATNIIYLTYKKGGVGHTLTAASKWICVELGWNDMHQSQAEDRCHRIGQKESVNCYYLIGKDTIDERMYDIILGKGQAAKATVGGTTEIEVKEHEQASYKQLIAELKEKAKSLKN